MKLTSKLIMYKIKMEAGWQRKDSMLGYQDGFCANTEAAGFKTAHQYCRPTLLKSEFPYANTVARN